MKKISKLLTIPLCCAAISTPAVASYIQGEPYFGFDAQIRHIKWKQGFGNNLFKTQYPQGNFFAGLRIEDYFGFEAGYEITPTRTSENRITANEVIVGNPVTGFLSPFGTPPVLTVSRFQVKGWHGDLMVYIPICEEFDFDFIGSVGLARLNMYHNVKVVADTATPLNPLTNNVTFKSEKTVLRFGGGAQYSIDDCYGMRLLFNWEQTSKFSVTRSLELPNGATRVEPKNSWMYGLGIFYKY